MTTTHRSSPQMRGHGAKRPRKQEQAIAALLEHGTITEAADAIGVAECTLRRWMARPDFQAAYDQARRKGLEEAMDRVRRGSCKALQALEDVLDDGEAPAAARVSAARAMLDGFFKVMELDQASMAQKQAQAVAPRPEVTFDFMGEMNKAMEEAMRRPVSPGLAPPKLDMNMFASHTGTPPRPAGEEPDAESPVAPEPRPPAVPVEQVSPISPGMNLRENRLKDLGPQRCRSVQPRQMERGEVPVS